MDGHNYPPHNLIINTLSFHSEINGDISYLYGNMSSHVICAFSVDYGGIVTERCYLDRNNLHPPSPIWSFCITQTDSNIDYQDRTEFWYATFYRAIVSILAQVLLQSFQVETRSTDHLVHNNQAVTPWRNQSTQAFE